MIERIPFPTFDGKQETWSELIRLFKELMTESGPNQVLERARLTGKIPEEAKKIITGIIDPNEAWERLDEQFGDNKGCPKKTEAA